LAFKERSVINAFTFVRKAFTPVLVLGILMLSTSASRVLAQSEDCQSALESSSGFTTLVNGDSTSQTNSVVEWDGEVIKIRTSAPGVLTITATGDASQGSLYTDGSSSTHPLVDSATVGTSQRELTAVVGSGDHCIQVAPGSGASGDIELTASFEDVCHLGTPDDHGDSFLCATPVTVGGSAVSGGIDSSTVEDSDMFTFELSSSATVTIASTGNGEDGGRLYGAGGSLIDSSNTDGASANFQIVQSLSAGRCYVRVTGPDESTYSVSVSASTP
jgi:hypothetical protein